MKDLYNFRFRSALLFGWLFTVSCCCVGQLESSLLWKISGNGIEEPSYLFGTVHSADKEVLSVDSTILQLIRSSDMFTGELDMSGGMGDMMGLDFSAFMMQGKKLEDLYDNPEDYKTVDEHITKHLGGMGAMIKKFKPFFIMVTIEEVAVKDTSDGDLFLDMHLQDYASSHDVEIKGLETMQEQMELFNAISLEQQAQLLLEQARDGVDFRKERSKLIQLYLSQDIEKLYQHTTEESSEVDNFQEKFIDQRNEQMASKIASLIKDKTVFNTFGAAHLAGEKGIINLLKAKGFEVTPMTIHY